MNWQFNWLLQKRRGECTISTGRTGWTRSEIAVDAAGTTTILTLAASALAPTRSETQRTSLESSLAGRHHSRTCSEVKTCSLFSSLCLLCSCGSYLSCSCKLIHIQGVSKLMLQTSGHCFLVQKEHKSWYNMGSISVCLLRLYLIFITKLTF